IGPDEVAVARWLMVSTLQGEFVSYDASFEHVNSLGDPRLSLIDRLDIHPMTHVIRVDVPEDDGLPDFLADDTPDIDNIADHIHNSDGTVVSVEAVVEASADGAPTPYDRQVQLTATMPAGWVYLRVDDPGAAEYRLIEVVRPDRRQIRVDDNAWTTHRILRPEGEPEEPENLLHLVDWIETPGPMTYTLTYGCVLGPGDPDCNNNNIPDECDIASGTSTDTNGDGIPDECESQSNPELSLNVAAGSECVSTTGLVMVTLDVTDLPSAINGVQALIHYDTAYMTLSSITPATGWSLIAPPNPDNPDPDGHGDVTCALYVPGGSVSSNGTVATLVFDPVAEGTTNVTFQADNDPFFTKLTVASDSSTILPDKQDSGTISIDNTVAGADSNSPVCEGGTIELYGGPSDGPDEPYTYAWAGPNGFTSSDQNPIISEATLGMDGTYTLTVNNGSGCQFVAHTDVEVQLCLTVNVEIQGLIGDSGVYGPPSVGADLVRDVTFVLTDCDGTTDTRVVPVTFTADTGNNKGVGSVIFTGLDGGIEWLSVQEGHTLRKLVAVDFTTTLSDSVTVFLSSGDFHTAIVGQDNLVDITDFSILASSWESIIDADESTGGDATGDGYHDADDFALIQPNFFQTGDAVDGCTRLLGDKRVIDVWRVSPAAVAPASPPVADIVLRAPRAGISVSELSLTVAHAERADLDGNGVIDVRDIRAFAERHDLPLLPQFETKLVELEAELTQLEPALELMPHHER
ncbi:MAG: hypothetical protein KAV82_02875, partial [Phycisphaerae bacterium]|nr:hypothetical protein [Phycisphaerae bacterium]